MEKNKTGRAKKNTAYLPQKKDLPTKSKIGRCKGVPDLPTGIQRTYLLFLQQAWGRKKTSPGLGQT